MNPAEIPPGLGAAFSVRAARRAGLTRGRLRSSDLHRPFHGARSIADAALVVDATDDAGRAYPRTPEVRRVHERATQYAPVMSPSAFFSGVTAAALWDTPLPRGVLAFPDERDPPCPHPSFDPDVLDVTVFWPAHAPRSAGVRGHAIRPGFAEPMAHPVSGLRLASPASTWAMLAGCLPHPYDLVAIADFFVHVRRPPHTRPWQTMPAPLATIAALTEMLDVGRRRGIGELRSALARVRAGSGSRTETWTRLTIVDAGLPEPVLDHDVFDHNRRFVARADLAYPHWRVAIEYEGTHHGARDQWERDIERQARLEAAGWRVIRVSRAMLFRDPRTIVARVDAAIAERNR